MTYVKIPCQCCGESFKVSDNRNEIYVCDKCEESEMKKDMGERLAKHLRRIWEKAYF